MARYNTPDELLSAWNQLLNSEAHIHPPEAAKRLGVPESALMASRIGTGATRLDPDIAAILEPIDKCGRVLCAFSNDCGVHMPLGHVKSYLSEGLLHLSGNHMTASLDSGAVTDAYLFIDTDDNHGNTRSLQFFDVSGCPLVKIFIFHKGKFSQFRDHLDQFISGNQGREINVPSKNAHSDQLASTQNAVLKNNNMPEGVHKNVFSSFFKDGGSFEIEMVAKYARVSWRGALEGVRLDKHMLHIHEPDVRSHLRFSAMKTTEPTRDEGLRVSGPNGTLLRIKRSAS